MPARRVRPFELGPVGLWAGDDVYTWIRSRVPRDWTLVRPTVQPETWLERSITGSVCVLDPVRFGAGSGPATSRGRPGGMAPAWVDNLAVFGANTLQRWVDGYAVGRSLDAPTSTPADILETVVDAAAEGYFAAAIAVVGRLRAEHPWVVRVLEGSLASPAPTRRQSRGSAPPSPAALGTTAAWSARLGVSPRTLRRYARGAGLRLGPTLRKIRAIRAVSLFYPPHLGWDVVAKRMGYRNQKSLASAITGSLAAPPGAAAERGLAWWVRALCQVLEEAAERKASEWGRE